MTTPAACWCVLHRHRRTRGLVAASHHGRRRCAPPLPPDVEADPTNPCRRNRLAGLAGEALPIRRYRGVRHLASAQTRTRPPAWALMRGQWSPHGAIVVASGWRPPSGPADPLTHRHGSAPPRWRPATEPSGGKWSSRAPTETARRQHGDRPPAQPGRRRPADGQRRSARREPPRRLTRLPPSLRRAYAHRRRVSDETPADTPTHRPAATHGHSNGGPRPPTRRPAPLRRLPATPTATATHGHRHAHGHGYATSTPVPPTATPTVTITHRDADADVDVGDQSRSSRRRHSYTRCHANAPPPRRPATTTAWPPRRPSGPQCGPPSTCDESRCYLTHPPLEATLTTTLPSKRWLAIAPHSEPSAGVVTCRSRRFGGLGSLARFNLFHAHPLVVASRCVTAARSHRPLC